MKTSKIVATLLMSTMLLTGCGVKKQDVIIKVNDGVITQQQFDEILDKQIASSPFAQMGDVKGDKDGFMYLMLAQRIVNHLVVEEMLNQEIKARGIKVTNKDIDEAIKEIMDKVGGRDVLMQTLKDNNISIKDFKKDIKQQVKMKKLAESTGTFEISDKEAQDFYNKNLKSFKHPEQVRASHILISANPYEIAQEISSDPKNELSEQEVKAKVDEKLAQKKEEAEKLLKELTADPSKFAQYAKKYSQDPGSAKNGGDLGFFDKEKMVPEFSKAAFGTKPNSAPVLVQTNYGYHILIVTDRQEAGTVPFDKAKEDVKAYLKNQKELEALNDITIAAKKKATIEFVDEYYNPENIEKKLHTQVNDISNGAKEKLDAQKKQGAKK